MGQLSNKIRLVLTGVLAGVTVSMQAQLIATDDSRGDYKDPKTHERFQRRRNCVGAWQVHELKKGGLVVRLKTNQMVIDGLRKAGRNDDADKKEVEQYLTNKYIVRSWLDKYNFSKVYFMYSNESDSLLNGKRSGFFLDSTLKVDPAIEFTGDYYLLVDRDYVYNSSIGFVPEDSALTTVERGNPTREMAIVLKNKYGHQLKAPFPYYVQDKTYSEATVAKPIKVNYNGKAYAVPLMKQLTYDKYSTYVEQFNERIAKFYRNSPAPESMDYYEDSKPFFY